MANTPIERDVDQKAAADVSADLTRTLARLADEYGPLGVALAAAEYTDKGALVRQWRANGDDMPRIMLDTPARIEPVSRFEAEQQMKRATVQPMEGDDAAPIPFQCMAELRAEIAQLDSWVSTFVGRMRPYCKTIDPVGQAALARSMSVSEERSPLENEILSARDRIESIIDVLDEMNSRLAL